VIVESLRTSLTLSSDDDVAAHLALICLMESACVINKQRNERIATTVIEAITVVAIVFVLFALTMSAVQRMRDASCQADCRNRMRQVAMALHSYVSRNGYFPPGCNSDTHEYQQPYMSWHVRILPDMEQSTLYDDAIKSFSQDRVFYHRPPHWHAETVFKTYGCPSDIRTQELIYQSNGKGHGLTSYLGANGTRASKSDGVLYLNSSVRFSDITDGTTNTLLIGERPPSTDLIFGWWYAGWGQDKNGEGDMILGTRVLNNENRSPECSVGPHLFKAGNLKNQCDFLHFWSTHSGGANFAFADGSVRFLRYSANEILPALGTRAGGDSVANVD
jgi:prepilin-type processing-associated H-X9-DG protein